MVQEICRALSAQAGPVVTPGAFVFAAAALEHNHIYGMCEGLIGAGAALRYVYEPDAVKRRRFQEKFPGVRTAADIDEILADTEVRLVAAAAVTSERCALGCRVMDAGKDYFTAKAPFTTLAQAALARAKVKETGRKYMVYYSERLHSESALLAGGLVARGAVGEVVQVAGLGPHRLHASSRPAWFFQKEKYGGILCDIGSHQIEQYLHFSGAKDARITAAHTGNFHHPAFPALEDFGEAMITGDNGTSGYFRVDWLTPDGLGTWGDGRTMILGTKGFIELRKYIDLAGSREGDHVFLVNDDGETRIAAAGRTGFPFFGQLILDCLARTEEAMTQEHAFRAGELCIQAQEAAVSIRKWENKEENDVCS